MYKKPPAKEGSVAARRHAPARKRSQLQLEMRAKWILRELERCPTYTYGQMIEAVRERFDIGTTMAEVAYTRARELFDEGLQNLDMTRLINEYWKLYELAVAEKKYAAAVRVLNSMGVATGVVAPRKHALEITGGIDINQRAHVAVLHLTPAQRSRREAELLLKAGMTDEDSAIVDTTIADALVALNIGGADAADDNE